MTKYKRNVIFIALLMFCCCREKAAEEAPLSESPKWIEADVTVVQNRAELLRPICSPDTARGSQRFLYRITDIAYAPPGRLLLLDNLNRAIRVVAKEDGRELGRFGRQGAGPGEFQSLGGIRYFGDRGILVIDNMLRRATLFDRNFKIKQTINLRYKTDDLAFLDDSTLVASSYLLLRDFRPLRILKATTGEVIREFGAIAEPQEGLFRKISESPFGKSDIELFSYGGMTRILLATDRRSVIFCQRNPYYLVSSSLSTDSSRLFNVRPPFATYDNFGYEVEGESRKATLNASPRILGIRCFGDQIFVPLFSADGSTNYLDIYTLAGDIVRRLALPGIESSLRVVAATFGTESELFVLVADKNQVCWIERISIKPGDK